jgi:hypothetical protein
MQGSFGSTLPPKPQDAILPMLDESAALVTTTPNLADWHLTDLRFNRHLEGHGPAPKT